MSSSNADQITSPDLHSLSASQMLAGLATKEFSSVELTEALIARIEAHDAVLNAMPIRLFEQARAQAIAADEARARGEGGPLCGLPISVKENLELVGTDATCGLTQLRNQPAREDAVVVASLRRAGAVILGKTNVPQLLLAQETDSPVYGRTQNPWNLERSPGGSSGGEGAAVAAGFSPLGIGTDIGGSIRIPAHFCGIFGLKPTVDRWSNRGSVGGIPGQEIVRSQVGPLARSTADLALAMASLSITEMAEADPRVPPFELGSPPKDLKGMRIGWYDTDGFLDPTAACRRAVAEARTSLEAAGATLVPITPPDAGEIIYLWLAAMSGDGGETMGARMGRDAPIPALKAARTLQRLPGAVRRAMAPTLQLMGEQRVARLMRVVGEKSVADLWQLTARRTALLRAEFDAWRAADVQAVICPAHSTAAMPHGDSGEYILGTGYLFRYSLCNFPAGVVPVTRVRAQEVAAEGAGADRVERLQVRIDRAAVGLPVGVQVVGRPWQEATVLGVMAAIEADVRARLSDFPHGPIDPPRIFQ